MGVSVKHISYHLPEKNFSNKDFFDLFPEMEQVESLKKIGFVNRKISALNETASDLALKAAENFFSETNFPKENIDFLIYSSLDFDHYIPATSIFIHGKLGLKSLCGTLDQSHGCSAYVYGIQSAVGLINSSVAKNVLLLTANTLTKMLHEKDKASRFVFGDGAAATLLSYSEKNKIFNPIFGTDASGVNKIIVKDGGQRNSVTDDSMKEFTDEYGNTTCNGKLFMDGVGVFLFSIKRVPQLIEDVLLKNNLKIADIDFFIFHQANYYIIETIAKKVGIELNKVFNNAANIGNTVGSTIPIALRDAQDKGLIKCGSKVMLLGFGTGLSWAGNIIEF